MDILTKDDIRALLEKQKGDCVSVFMPAHRAGSEVQQDRVRLKNLLREAEDRLAGLGHRSSEAEAFLKPARELLIDSVFWSYQGDGLAIFLSEDTFRYYRLPLRFSELVVVAGRFHIKPLLLFFTGDGKFFVLSISQDDVGLFQGTRYSLNEVDISNTGVPKNIAEALKYDDPEKQLQFHTGTPGTSGERAAMFHGHGVGTDDAKDNIRRFFLKIDRGLHAILRDQQAPLVTAGVEYLHPIYREVNTYPHLTIKGVAVNPGDLTAEELHGHAWKIVEPLFLKAQKEAIGMFGQLAGTGRTSSDIEVVVPAAYFGRVEFLFVPVGTQRWGNFDPDANKVYLHENAEPYSEDLLDFAAVQTYLHGGTVYAVEPQNMPDNVPIAAVFRY